jgi:hypothetical protein
VAVVVGTRADIYLGCVACALGTSHLLQLGNKHCRLGHWSDLWFDRLALGVDNQVSRALLAWSSTVIWQQGMCLHGFNPFVWWVISYCAGGLWTRPALFDRWCVVQMVHVSH